MPGPRKELLTQRDDLFVVHDFLSPEECEHFIALGEAAGFGDAPITSFSGPVMRKDIRNNDRVMIDDAPLAEAMWDRLEPFLADRGGLWLPVGLNERWRFYRYDPGQQFDWHFDGYYERSPRERSAFTFMIYLNGGVAGGATEFTWDSRPVAPKAGLHGRSTYSRGGVQNDDPVIRVQPEAGKALVFTHRVLHRGALVADGRKYVLRTDVMCRWREPVG